MRSLNAKRIAAVAAGAAMLGLALGTAFGACPDISKNWVYDANGNPIVQIVVGSNAKLSDGIAAANLAAVIGSKAYVEGGQSKTVQGTGEVKLQIQGVSPTPTTGVWNDYALNAGADNGVQSNAISLTLGESQGMYSGTMNWNGTDYDYKEEVDVSGVTLQYYEDKDTHGIFFNVPTEGIVYKVYFTGNYPFAGVDGKLSNAPEIKFLGKSYVINEVHNNEIILMSGEKTSLGIGQSTTMTIGNTTYTVTLKDASYNEGTKVGYATVEVSDGTNTYTLNLDTSDNQDSNAGGLYVFLQSVQKSYTPGVGGTAILRLGGEKLDLVSGSDFPGYSDWKVKIDSDASGLHYIELYSKSISPNDGMTQIVGPENYFTLKYDGTSLDLGTINHGTATVSGAQSTEGTTAYDYIDSITFTDKNGNSYTFDPYNTDDYRSQLFFGNTAGAVDDGSGNYLPLRQGDIVAVAGIPIVIDNIYYNTTSTYQPYVQWHMPGGSSVKSYLTVTSTVTGGTNAIAPYLGAVNATSTKLYCGTIDVNTNVGAKTLNVCIANDDMVNFTDQEGNEPTMWVTGGASTNLESKYYTITAANPTWAGTAYTKGNYTVTFTGTANPTSGYDKAIVSYVGGYNADYTGIEVTDGEATPAVLANQAIKDASDDNYMYGMTNYLTVKADGDTATLTFAEKNIDVRAELVPGQAQSSGTTTNAITVTTSDTFPKEVASGVTVEDLTCTANVPGTYTFGTIPNNLVITDATTPTASHVIVIGSYYVNKLAVGHTESLQSAGQKLCEFSDDGNTLYVAGYTAQDTIDAVNELIDKIKAL